MKAYSSTNVYDAAFSRAVNMFKEGHRIVVAFSGGKDSTAVFELMYAAAVYVGILPLEVWMRDEEIMYPGTYEYAERIANRKGVKFHWLIAGEPEVNVFNRENPYWWVFDDRLDPDQWMRKPPEFAKRTKELSIYNVVNPTSFPPPPGKLLCVTMGVRASESRKRNMMIHRSGGAVSGMTSSKAKTWEADGRNREKEIHFRPIYDWTTKDVWFAIKEKGWDYNKAYDAFTLYGVKREQQRIAPVTVKGVPLLKVAYGAWPEWFQRLNVRLPGVILGAKYGKKAVMPIRRHYETWQECYQRTCIDEAPAWIAERAEVYREWMIKRHAAHSTDPIMDIAACPTCAGGKASWKAMAENMYNGDPFMLQTDCTAFGYVEPEFFRKGMGVWGGKPTMG